MPNNKNELDYEEIPENEELEDEFSGAWDDMETEPFNIEKTQKAVEEIRNKAENLPDYSDLLSEEDKQIDNRLTKRIAQDLARLNATKTQKLLDELTKMGKECEEKANALSQYLENAQEIKKNKINDLTADVYQKNLDVKNEFVNGNLSSQQNIDMQSANFSDYLKKCAEIDQLSEKDIEAATQNLQQIKSTLEIIKGEQDLVTRQHEQYQLQTQSVSLNKFVEQVKSTAVQTKGKLTQKLEQVQCMVNATSERYNQKLSDNLKCFSKQIHDTVVKLHSVINGLKEHLDHTLESLGKGRDKVIEAFHDAGRYAYRANRMVMDITIQNHAQEMDYHMSQYQALMEAREKIQETFDYNAQMNPASRLLNNRAYQTQKNINHSLRTMLAQIDHDINKEHKTIVHEGREVVQHIENYMRSYHKLQDHYYAHDEERQPQQDLDSAIKSAQMKQAKDALETAVNLFKSVTSKDDLTICGASFSRDDKSGQIYIDGEPASNKKIEEFIVNVGSKQVITEAHDTMNNIYQVTATQAGKETKDDLML